MLYNTLSNVNKYEILKLFVVGIETEILSVDDLADYVLNQIENSETPDLDYCEIALNLSKDWKQLRSLISEISSGFVYNKADISYRLLIGIVGEQFDRKIITLKEITELFYKLAVIYAPYSEMVLINDYYELAEEGICQDFSMVEKKVRKVLEENKQEVT